MSDGGGESKGVTSFQKFAEEKSVLDIPELEKKRSLIIVDKDTDVGSALQILRKHKISSAPVVSTPSEESTEFFHGMVDAGTVLRKLFESKLVEELQNSIKKGINSDEAIEDFQEKLGSVCREFWKKKIGEVCGHDVTLLRSVSDKTSIKELITKLLIDKEGHQIHRIALIDETKVKAIVTQSDVIKFLHANLQHLGDLKEKTIEDLDLYNSKKPLVTVTTFTLTMEAFRVLYTKKVSAVGVVDDNGVLVGNLSNSDLRGFNQDRFSHLMLSTGEFLKIQKALSRGFATVLNARLNALRALAVPVGSKFGELLRLIVENRVHRAYVVDVNFKPVGVISLSDILSHLGEKLTSS